MKRLVAAGLVAAATAVPAGTTAWAVNSPPPAMNISYLSGARSSAHWLPQQMASQLHVGYSFGGPVGGPIASCGSPGDRTTYTYGCGYTKIVFHHFEAALPTVEPTFVTDFYQSGTPRWYILFSSGDYLFGYPNTVGSLGSFNWELHVGTTVTYYLDWSAAYAATSSETVTEVRIVADASAPTPYTATITLLQYDGQYPTP